MQWQLLCSSFFILAIVAAPEPVSSGDFHAVIVSASAQWHNYRHHANALAVAQALQRPGNEPRLQLLLADQALSANPRNAAPGQLYANPQLRLQLQQPVAGELRGDSCGVQNLQRGRWSNVKFYLFSSMAHYGFWRGPSSH